MLYSDSVCVRRGGVRTEFPNGLKWFNTCLEIISERAPNMNCLSTGTSRLKPQGSHLTLPWWQNYLIHRYHSPRRQVSSFFFSYTGTCYIQGKCKVGFFSQKYTKTPFWTWRSELRNPEKRTPQFTDQLSCDVTRQLRPQGEIDCEWRNII